MRKLKDTIVGISEKLGMQIPNIGETRSRRRYNKYLLEYRSVSQIDDDSVLPSVIIETSFDEISFPTEVMPVHSYIGDMMETEAPEERKTYLLDPFEMKVQTLDRTLIDKVFAICDYCMKGEIRRHSRHIYDIYKILPFVPATQDFKALISKVRLIRAENEKLCPSARPDIDVSALLLQIFNEGIYKSDYEDITSKLLEEPVPYEVAAEAIKQIAASGVFNFN